MALSQIDAIKESQPLAWGFGLSEQPVAVLRMREVIAQRRVGAALIST